MKIGKVTENALKRSILKQIKTKREEVLSGAGLGGDCAIFSLNSGKFVNKNDEDVMISCTCGGEFDVTLYIQRGVNILASRGAIPVAIGLQILLPLDAEELVLKDLMKTAEEACSALQIEIAQVGAQVTPVVTAPYVTVTAYGTGVRSADVHTVSRAKPGQDIVISKWLGLAGTSILASRQEETIKSRYPSWVANEAKDFTKYMSTVPEAAVAMKSGVCTLYHLSEGGILAALWELCEGAGVGLTIDLKKLPLRQETVEICNLLNVNPYELMSDGSLLMTTEDGPGLVNALATEGIPAVIVGKITDSNDKLIINEDETRFLDRPHPDSIYELQI